MCPVGGSTREGSPLCNHKARFDRDDEQEKAEAQVQRKSGIGVAVFEKMVLLSMVPLVAVGYKK